jgi:hypothetical protein
MLISDSKVRAPALSFAYVQRKGRMCSTSRRHELPGGIVELAPTNKNLPHFYLIKSDASHIDRILQAK